MAAANLDYLAHIRTESARFAEVLRDCDPDAAVPTCPDWTATDLLAHLVKVQRFWTTIVRERLDHPARAEAAEDAAPSDYAELLADFDAGTAELVRVLADTADDVDVWTWSADHTAGFVKRRQAHEVLIHRMDAEMTASLVTEFDPALALDGVDEAMRVMLGGRPSWAVWRPDEACGEVRVRDTDSAWRFRLGTLTGAAPDTGNALVDEGAVEIDDTVEPTFVVSGTAGDLDAWLWNRPTWGNLATDGDHEAFERFRAIVRTGVQ